MNQPVVFPCAASVVSQRARSLLLGSVCFVLALAGGSTRTVHAADGDLQLQAQLIWGTDGEKPAGVKCKDVDPALRKRLSRVFKWKHYYEMRRRRVSLPPKRTKRLEMSKHCLLKFTIPEKGVVEVKLIGEGRLTKTMRQPVKALRNGELLVLAGETKENINDAWFVVISVPAPEKPPVPGSTPRPDPGN